MSKQTDIKKWGHQQVTMGFKYREWYQLKDALQHSLNEKRTLLNKEENKLRPLRDDIHSEITLITKIETMLSEFKDEIREKMDEQPKWVQQQARNQPVPCSFGRAR